MTIYEKLLSIQNELKVPKNQRNNFGNYNFRSCEDILEEVKPICQKNNVVITVSDEIKQIGERYYVEATASLIDIETSEKIVNKASAREEDSKKGMDASQVTGASSSYARKYALNGLLAIDDNKDADTDEFAKQQQNKGTNKPITKKESIKTISVPQQKRLFALANNRTDVVKNVITRYKYDKTEQIKVSDYDQICTEIEAEINM